MKNMGTPQTTTITTEKIYVSIVERLLTAVYSNHTHKNYNINPRGIENLKHFKVRKDLISNYASSMLNTFDIPPLL